MPAASSWFDRHYGLLRRLHSLTGIVPVGAFLVFHLLTNSSIVWGMLDARKGDSPAARGMGTFDHEVGFIYSLPFLLLLEVFGLWVPIAFHAIFGIYYARTGAMNVAAYPYPSNRRYALQRFSGYVGLVFILYHVATLRWGWIWLPYAGEFNARAAAETTALAVQGGTPGLGFDGIVVAAFYLLGASLLVFHFANGLWTAGITWGLTVSAAAQRRWGYACATLGVGLMAMTWMAVVGFATLDPARASLHAVPHADAAPLLDHAAPR